MSITNNLRASKNNFLDAMKRMLLTGSNWLEIKPSGVGSTLRVANAHRASSVLAISQNELNN